MVIHQKQQSRFFMSKHWLEVKNEAEAAEIVISGRIGKSWWDDSGTSSKEFRDELSKIPKNKKINFRINSEGGSIKDGLEIYNALKERSKHVTSYITGYAASISSVIPLAASRVVSPKGSIWMMHEPWSMTEGNADDHLRSAEMLDKHGDMLADIYADETGASKEDMRAKMRAETWFTGIQAADMGFADETPDEDVEDALKAIDILASYPISGPWKSRFSVLAGVKKHPPLDPTNPAVTTPAASISPVKPGESGTASLTNQTNTTTMPETVTPAAPTNTADALADLRKEVKAANRARIRSEVLRLGENKITNDKIDWWTDRAVDDEAGTMAVIKDLPSNSVGSDSVGHVVILSENPLEKINKEHTSADARHRAIMADWNGLINDAFARDKRQGQVYGENTYSSTLITSFLITGAITQLTPRFAALNCFTRDNSVDAYKPRATGVMKFNQTATDGSTTQTNATNFESGDSTVNPVSITVSQYTEAYHVTNDQLNSGLRMEDLMVAKLASFGAKVTSVVTTPITVANFSTLTPLISAPSSFGFSDLQTCWGQLKKSIIHNALLDGEYLARIINVPTIFQKTGVMPGKAWAEFGWDNIALNTFWSGADPNVRGFACNPQAIGIITGLPLEAPNIPGQTLQQGVALLPEVNVAIQVNSWFSLSTRTLWASYDMMLGAALLDGTAGVLIKSA